MKTAIVTGASGGIGRAVAERLLGAGWQVGLIARREDRLQAMAAQHPGAMALVADVTDPAQVEAAFAGFAARHPRLDLLFNNAGIFTPPAPIDEIPVSDWMQAVGVNLTGMFLCARAAFGAIRRQSPQGGRIINNGSISAHVPREGSVTYTATKHGVTGLTRSLSLDGRPFDIACGQIDIGNARTEMVEAMIARSRAAGLPEPYTIDVGLVADAVLAMASLPLAANVQFQTLMATRMPYIGRG
jgi:NAD(P)-dependent dehydrogenase (short-subunit alcohol dehydrogenase family)